MLKALEEFRKKLDDIMVKAIHSRVLLYGYGYTGRFLKWYAEYYHSIEVDYIVTLDSSFSRAYDMELFQNTVFDFNYKGVSDAIVWVAEPMDDSLTIFLKERGFIENETYFDFYAAVYQQDVSWGKSDELDVFKMRKSGKRDIQFLEYLEWKYGCNFLQAIEKEGFEVAGDHATAYRVTTQKEIFPILDRCHIIPGEEDAIFDYGCGKGGAMVSFLDYGFKRVGGVEYEPKIYNILQDNLEKLSLQNAGGGVKIECIQGDAAKVNEQLDQYNWFYFFNPFDETIFEQCIDAICDSLNRRNRKIHIIYNTPFCQKYLEEKECFRLTNQFTVEMRQRVVSVYENYNNLP